MNHFNVAAILCLLLLWTNAEATDFECIASDDLRHVSLDYPGQDHLCEVSVTKRDGKREIKWYADNDSQFCADKMDLLIEKYQQQWNFKCERWPDRNGMVTLEERQRSLIDSLRLLK